MEEESSKLMGYCVYSSSPWDPFILRERGSPYPSTKQGGTKGGRMAIAKGLAGQPLRPIRPPFQVLVPHHKAIGPSWAFPQEGPNKVGCLLLTKSINTLILIILN
jgi:hypothetical protein